MNEIIAGMKVIKMYCWEQPMSQKLATLRKLALSCITREVYPILH